ncbi:lipocalin family protein [Tranquillimonas alkanivorans]|uniref:Predicted secreted hydrolase n=1 Tax=Tranquillimonas alkanivorans TaxID=441119 RepID=A0A1I5WGC7_9RHOB|nr:lipocalin family protein [Tranquillimonas alkanivorans]SFQ18863.1 Predicted secreted hydrolase [Tranquillimonas alkanivorans]
MLAVGLAVAMALLIGGAREGGTTDGSGGAGALVSELAAMSEEAAFERPSGPWRLSLPGDHGGHPEARTEGWMIAAHLEDEHGALVGMTFLRSRFGLREDGGSGAGVDQWDLRALYRGHVTLAREAAGVLGEERFSRGGGVAGHDDEAREVWLDHWNLTYGDGPEEDVLTLSASVEDVPLRLTLTPAKPAVQMDPEGEAPMRGFTIPRMRVEGEIGRDDARTRVSGVALLDHLWGELPLPGGPLSRDRLVLQLDDGTDLTLVRTRRREGGGAATVDGLVVDAAGEADALSDGAVEMEPMTHWSPAGAAQEYPVAWELSGQGLELRVTPVIEDQTHGFVLGGWDGMVRAEGTREGAPVQGRGTLQLTGYEDQ